MPEPSIDRKRDGAVYFTDAAGVRWRVHDARWRTGLRWQRFAPGDRRATHRIFVSSDAKTKRVIPLESVQDRGLEPAQLEVQLARTTYLGEISRSTMNLDPR